MRILIAEDEASQLEMITSSIKKMGHEGIAADDGQHAWNILQEEEDLQVLVSDWVMPKMDGLELCRRVRSLRRPHYTYVILVTVKSGIQNFLTGMEAGADDFISKPFNVAQLEARLVVAERIIKLRYQFSQLEQLLPVCAYCKKIRQQGSGWMSLEDYLAGKAGVDLTHGICPSCYTNVVLPQLDKLPDLPEVDP